MGSVQVAHVPTEQEQQAAAEVAEMMEKAHRIMQDPEKVKLLAKRIQAAFASEAFVAKMRSEMAALQHDEAFQVQPLAPSFRGAPKALAPRAGASVMEATLNTQDKPDGDWDLDGLLEMMDDAAPSGDGAFNTVEFMKTLPGVSQPMGYFDPLDLAESLSNPYDPMTKGKALFMREVELKHCRLAMLAALGFPIAEQFHPLFGGDIDVQSFQASPLQGFWGTVVFAIAIPEIFSVFSFQE